MNVGTGVFANAVYPNGRNSTLYNTFGDIFNDFPCIQNISPGTLIPDGDNRDCYVSQYDTNLIWFGAIQAGTSIEIKSQGQGQYTSIGSQNTPAVDALGYLVEYEISIGDEVCIVAPNSLVMSDLQRDGYHMRIGLHLDEYFPVWCNVTENDGTQHWCR